MQVPNHQEASALRCCRAARYGWAVSYFGGLVAGSLAEAAARVGQLRSWLAGRAAGQAPATQSPAAMQAPAGLNAARRAIRVSGLVRPLIDPVVVELDSPRNMAAGAVPWGLGPWLNGRAGRRIDTGLPAARLDREVEDVLTAADGRPLVVVVRDAHWHPGARAAVSALLAGHPDGVVVEMGLPTWRPPSGAYVATYGAARTSGQAAAEALGLATT